MEGTQFKAWVVETHAGEGRDLICKNWWHEHIPAHMEGCVVALFKTRAVARQHLPSVRAAFPKAHVTRVEVRVIEKGETC